MVEVPNVMLNDGNMIPALGLGELSMTLINLARKRFVQVLGSQSLMPKKSLLQSFTRSKTRDTDTSIVLGMLIIITRRLRHLVLTLNMPFSGSTRTRKSLAIAYMHQVFLDLKYLYAAVMRTFLSDMSSSRLNSESSISTYRSQARSGVLGSIV